MNNVRPLFWKMSLLVCLAIGGLFLFIFWSESPSDQYEKTYCTRYCHNNGCPHFSAQHPQQKWLLEQHIQWLNSRPFGLSYRAASVLFYAVLFPTLLVLGLFSLCLKISTNKPKIEK